MTPMITRQARTVSAVGIVRERDPNAPRGTRQEPTPYADYPNPAAKPVIELYEETSDQRFLEAALGALEGEVDVEPADMVVVAAALIVGIGALVWWRSGPADTQVRAHLSRGRDAVSRAPMESMSACASDRVNALIAPLVAE